MKKLLLAACILSTTSCFSQQSLNVIPTPAKAEMKQGTFTISSATKIIFSASGVEKSAAFLNHYLKEYYGFELQMSKDASKNVIELNYAGQNNALPGAYKMNVDNDKVYIAGNDEQGVFYGIQ